ncbi:polar amino acid transport system permease protein [Methanococcus maripaludis]|uniref:Polar amino acid transport system permease protein n=1 Tax=Methanococcus maripaludis TaxID=39152 RepID=A0A7J9NK23_METMI|nr:amino acid ABC transporter permease [Methanococcus maripaludis]MBA2840629.1 polar amino acid transport system permease protein [Methanococcus maripaludis]MBA2853252.1 polar amino acid transport system permease protein [Methanococcus maripaludis]MBB6401864.1 polar amino acid transport system permease protein [Methanococcus maripaludis]
MVQSILSQFNLELFLKIIPQLIDGSVMTIKITVFSIIIGLFLGTILGMGRISHNVIYRYFSSFYIEFVRGTPLLVQIMIIYFGLPSFGINLSAYAAGILALGLNSGAYVGEIIKAGILSVHVGQMEAARSLGMNYTKAMRYIILPQAFRNVLPAIGNEFILLLKDSSLLSTIAIIELTRVGKQIYSSTYNAWTPLLGVALFYLIMTLPLSKLVQYIENRWKIDRNS